MIDNGLGFALVPWTPAIESHLGRHIAGVSPGRARGSNGVSGATGCEGRFIWKW
jgi:hypothetical protein